MTNGPYETETGDWDWDPKTDPAWDNPAIPRLRIPQEDYPALADAVVRGASIAYCVIEDLKALVDAVQGHPKATLGRTDENESGHLSQLGVFDADGAGTQNDPTAVVIHGCVIESCKMRPTASERIEIGCILEFQARFVTDAWYRDVNFAEYVSFSNARFAADAIFGHARFAAHTTFRGARFTADAWFEETHFGASTCFANTSFAHILSLNQAQFAGDAEFDKAQFAENAWFEATYFAAEALFSRVKFDSEARFEGARFADNATFGYAIFHSIACFENTHFESDAWFGGTQFNNYASFWTASFAADVLFNASRFNGPISFVDTVFNRRLIFSHATFGPFAKLAIRSIVVHAGASLHLDTAHLLLTTQDTDKSQHWIQAEQAAITRWSHDDRARGITAQRALVQYVEASVILPFRWMLERAPFWAEQIFRCTGNVFGADTIPFGLGLGPRGRLIEGEDTDNKDELRKAAEAYNLLRDIFRAQPSTDTHEEICAIKYHDLIRRSKPRPRWSSHIPGFFHWLVMRNALGYLMNPWRPIITGALLMLGFTLIYGVFIDEPGEISHGAFTPAIDPVTKEVTYNGDALTYWKNDFLNPLYLSLMTFVTLGYGDFQPAAGWLKLVTGIEGILGVTLLALFTVAWGRKMVR